jgi:hypothetical protein
MKTGFHVIALTAGLLTAAMAGSALAGDRSANGADPEAVLNPVWMVEGPIETGVLPGVHETILALKGRQSFSGDSSEGTAGEKLSTEARDRIKQSH